MVRPNLLSFKRQALHVTCYKDFCHCGCQINQAVLYLTMLTDPGCRSPPRLKMKHPTWERRLEEILADKEDAR